ncbi:MAG: 4'-phosphopantetheinyl transferase family protein, partial [Isosphaeraceae bacterium]
SPSLADDEVRVWVVGLDEGLPGNSESESDADALEPGPELAILSEDERARAARFVRARERRRFARCRAALRRILGELLDRPPGSLRFRARAAGKPELDPEASIDPEAARPISFRFNVSHSADLAVIAVAAGREVGVDVERLKAVGEAERIVASFFTSAENAAFAAIPESERPVAFLRGWTRKEAVLKAFGSGIAGLAARHETGFGRGELAARFEPVGPSHRVDRWALWEAAPRPGFVAALAVDAEQRSFLDPGASS